MCMNLPTVRFRAMLERVLNGKKTPKYRITQVAGSAEFWGELLANEKGRDEKVNVYLKGELELIKAKAESTDSFLQFTRDGMRLTGLYEYLRDGKMSGYAFGNPLPTATFQDKPNWLYPYKDDAYLFKFYPNRQNHNDMIPVKFEWVVLQGGEVERIKQKCLTMFMNGGFDKDLSELPLQSVDEL